MSDTHGNTLWMFEVAEAMEADFGAQVIFHLGDDYEDAETLAAAGYDVRMVPGLWCRAYADGRTPKRLYETFDGVSIVCAHSEKDLRKADRSAGVVLTGHTHEARIELIGKSLYVNPGHLKGARSRGRPPSYAVVVIEPGAVRASIHGLDGTVCLQQVVDRDVLSE